ncbi:hypothetical protein [Kutzneria sp. NPDC052558]|uniref:hypothetical protein n=1 Tax=Kutzneria sp. NPDC052558 TaxID=3364121 RepID=UPI0037C5444E
MRLGAIGFDGPIATVGYMQRDLVERRAWIDRQDFTRAHPCARCGDVREPAARDEDGRPLCPTCYVSEPANLQDCMGCGRRRRVGIRTPEGPLCESCRPWKTVTCEICGRKGPGLISKTTGKPWCRSCKQRWITSAGCGETAQLRGGTLAEPLCSTCTRPDADFWRSRPVCGQPGRIHAGRCARCTIRAPNTVAGGPVGGSR